MLNLKSIAFAIFTAIAMVGISLSPARATLMNVTGSVDASGFSANFGATLPAPADPLTATFAFRYDTSIFGSYNLSSLSLVINSIVFDENNSFVSYETSGNLRISANLNGRNAAPFTDDFVIEFTPNYPMVFFAYTTSTSDGNFSVNTFQNNAGQVAIFNHQIVPAVPEPATLMLFGFGLAGLGFVRRRRAT